jgi:hypothetical protein
LAMPGTPVHVDFRVVSSPIALSMGLLNILYLCIRGPGNTRYIFHFLHSDWQ